MSQKIILLVVLLAVTGGLMTLLPPSSDEEQVFCTMEAKLCSDGSYVGRTGPNCEFTPCPNEGGGGGGGILPYKSGISGVVLRGPMCPVMREPPDPKCADAAYTTEVIVSRSITPSKIFATMESGKDGKFLFNLPPGDYVVNAKNDGISKTCESVFVTVGPDEVENIIISCDTGIR